MTVRALKSTAQGIQLLAAEAIGLRAELERLVTAIAPWLLELPGVGPISAAQVLVSWSHAGRLRSESAVLARLRDDPATRAYAAVVAVRARASERSAAASLAEYLRL